MNPTLRNFYNNQNERETVKLFMVEVLKEIAVEKAFDGEDVIGIQEAKNLIDVMFNKLEDLYGEVKEPIISNSR